MRLPFGLELTRRDVVETTLLKSLAPVYAQSLSTSWNWYWPIRESFTGAWQQNVTVDPPPNLLAFSAVFCCVTGIAADISKCRIKLSQDVNGIWTEVDWISPFAAVLAKPNHYQTHIEFIAQWIVSELLNGNTYVLKERDQRGIVTALYVLDPMRVKPLVADNGDVYYELAADYLSHVGEPIVVPALEIIHDKMVPLWHPLVGVSPLYACGISATMGNKIQNQSTNTFANAARPGGVLTAPGHIADDTAARLKAAFEANFTGANVGRLAVLGDGLKFEPMVLAPEVLQLIEQLKWTVDDVARAFHYPSYKLGGTFPPYSSGPEALTTSYYSDCLQILIEKVEKLLDVGLALPDGLHAEMDLDNLMRMDTAALYASNNAAVSGGWMSPDEARFRANFNNVKGGNTPYLQQQNYSLAALAKRDAQKDPFSSNAPAAPPPQTTPPQPPAEEPKAFDDYDVAYLIVEVANEMNELRERGFETAKAN